MAAGESVAEPSGGQPVACTFLSGPADSGASGGAALPPSGQLGHCASGESLEKSLYLPSVPFSAGGSALLDGRVTASHPPLGDLAHRRVGPLWTLLGEWGRGPGPCSGIHGPFQRAATRGRYELVDQCENHPRVGSGAGAQLPPQSSGFPAFLEAPESEMLLQKGARSPPSCGAAMAMAFGCIVSGGPPMGTHCLPGSLGLGGSLPCPLASPPRGWAPS